MKISYRVVRLIVWFALVVESVVVALSGDDFAIHVFAFVLFVWIVLDMLSVRGASL